MRTAEEIYQKSLAILGEEDGEETAHFRRRAVGLINLVLSQCYETDLALRGESLPAVQELCQIDTLEHLVDACDPVLLSLLPLGLAGYLILEEAPARAAALLERYERERELMRLRSRRGRRHKIRREY